MTREGLLHNLEIIRGLCIKYNMGIQDYNVINLVCDAFENEYSDNEDNIVVNKVTVDFNAKDIKFLDADNNEIDALNVVTTRNDAMVAIGKNFYACSSNGKDSMMQLVSAVDTRETVEFIRELTYEERTEYYDTISDSKYYIDKQTGECIPKYSNEIVESELRELYKTHR